MEQGFFVSFVPFCGPVFSAFSWSLPAQPFFATVAGYEK
jgi:hypothetical protein